MNSWEQGLWARIEQDLTGFDPDHQWTLGGWSVARMYWVSVATYMLVAMGGNQLGLVLASCLAMVGAWGLVSIRVAQTAGSRSQR